MSFNPDKHKKSVVRTDTRKPRLWIATELYYPEETSTGYYLTKIAEGLAEDFEVKVICGQPNYFSRGTYAPKYENLKGVDIYRVFSTRFNKNVILYRLINMFTLSFSIFFKCLFYFNKNDKVLVVTTPPLLPFITGFAAKLHKSKHILLIHDNYPEILIAADKAKPDSFFTRTLNFFNQRLFQSAHKIIVVGRDMKELVSRKMAPEGIDKIFVIPNWAELETVSPAPRNENTLLSELGLQEKLVFLYAGNMGYPNDIESFIETAGKLSSDDRFHFIFLGTGVKKILLENAVKNMYLKNITLLDPKPRSEQKIFLNACDVAIVSLIKKMWGVSMPSRTYNILAAGKPILAICEKDSEIELIVKEEGVGWSIPPGEPLKLEKTITKIYERKDTLEEFGKLARTSATEKYSLEKALERYRQVLI